MLKIDQLFQLMFGLGVLRIRFIQFRHVIELDGVNTVPTLVKRRPYNALPADTDLFQQPVLTE